MAGQKTKIVEVNGTRYQLGKFTPDAGSYILMRILGASILTGDKAGPSQQASPQPDVKPKGEDLVRATTFAAFLRGLSFEDHSFIQSKCLACCCRVEEHEQGGEIPMPLVNVSGQWAIQELKDDIPTIMKLEMEVLVFNLAGFFDQGGMNAMAGMPPQPA